MSRIPRHVLITTALFLSLATSSIAGWAQAVFDTTPSLIFSTSPANQPITLTLRQATLRYDLKVYATKSDLKDVRILAEPFLDENLQAVQPRLSFGGDETGTPRDLKPGDSKRLILEAEFPETGTYTTYLTPWYDGRSWPPLTITVNRVSSKPPDLEVADIPAGRAEVWGTKEGRKASLPITLLEKSDQPLTSATTQLVSLAKKDREAKFSAKVHFAVDGETKETTSSFGAGTPPCHRITVELSDFPEAGLYEGTLRFSADGATPVKKDFSVYVREPIWILFICISTGALISVVLREYLARRRPRLMQLRRASILAHDLDDTLRGKDQNERSRELGFELKSQLTHIVHDLQLDTLDAETAKGRLGVFDMKIELLEEWLVLHEEELKAGSGANEALTKGLRDIETVLRKVYADDAAVRSASDLAASLWQYTTVLEKPTASVFKSVRRLPVSRQQPSPSWMSLLNRLSRVSSQLLTSDVLATAAVILLAVLLGVKTLWAGDLAWGGWEDRVVALLWGLGLHQTSFAGIDALRLTFTT